MRLPIIISRFSNLLFFLQRTKQDCLAELDSREYPAVENIDLFFYGKNEGQIWKQIKKSAGEQNAESIKKAVAPLKPEFVSHWQKASKHLLLWKQYFQNNHLLFHQSILNAKKLNGIKRFAVSNVPIYLISNPSDNKEISAWFSWTPKESFMVVEIPLGLKIPNNLFPLAVLTHECFHLILRKNKNLFSKINKTAEENKKIFTRSSGGMPNRIFLEELLISSFIPEGYLSEKHFNIKVSAYTSKPKDLLDWRKLIAFELRNMAKKYTDGNRQIDEKYFEYIIKTIKRK